MSICMLSGSSALLVGAKQPCRPQLPLHDAEDIYYYYSPLFFVGNNIYFNKVLIITLRLIIPSHTRALCICMVSKKIKSLHLPIFNCLSQGKRAKTRLDIITLTPIIISIVHTVQVISTSSIHDFLDPNLLASPDENLIFSASLL